jgi:hypothetical protein
VLKLRCSLGVPSHSMLCQSTLHRAQVGQLVPPRRSVIPVAQVVGVCFAMCVSTNYVCSSRFQAACCCITSVTLSCGCIPLLVRWRVNPIKLRSFCGTYIAQMCFSSFVQCQGVGRLYDPVEAVCESRLVWRDPYPVALSSSVSCVL